MSDSNSFSFDQRKAVRKAVSYRGTCRTVAGRTLKVWVTDISAEGCRLRFREPPLLANDWVLVEIAGLRELGATVQWSDGGTAGLRFFHPLPSDILDKLTRAFPV